MQIACRVHRNISLSVKDFRFSSIGFRGAGQESGCPRTLTDVEYLPFGMMPDWIHAFLTLYTNRHSGLSFCKPHFIIDYKREFEGHLFVA